MPIRTGRKLRKENSNSESKHGREKAKPLQKKKVTRATNTQTDKQTNKQTNKQTDKQTDTQTSGLNLPQCEKTIEEEETCLLLWLVFPA